MESALTQSNIVFLLGILGVLGGLFSVWNYFHKPQEDVDKKATLLAQQVQWEREANEKKFSEFGLRLDNSIALAQNHIHTIDVKVDKLTEAMNMMNNGIVELRTIINERVPTSLK